MTNKKLPELPEPWQCETGMCPQLFTADQLRAYGDEREAYGRATAFAEVAGDWMLVGQEISPNYIPEPIQHPDCKPPEPMLTRYHWRRAIGAWTEGRDGSEPPRPDATRPAMPDGWRLAAYQKAINRIDDLSEYRQVTRKQIEQVLLELTDSLLAAAPAPRSSI